MSRSELGAKPGILHPIAQARQILRAEAAALQDVAERLDERCELGEKFEQVVAHIAECAGRIAVTGIGKSADVAQKLVGTFNSTGTRAVFLDPTRALHGDLGMLHPNDVVLVLSHSGESEEVVRLLGPLQNLVAAILGITGNQAGTLARLADAALVYGPVVESDPLALAPSTSSTVMMVLGHAIAFVLSEYRQFTREEFARYHPAGSLGRKLATVESAMRRGTDLRLARASESVRSVFASSKHLGRRTGAIILVDDKGALAGLFTDSDLARLFEQNMGDVFDRPIAEFMTRTPITVGPKVRMAEAIEIMRTRKISELPVVDESCRPVGMLDITDLIGLAGLEEKSGSHAGPLRLWSSESA
jgi:arabinose-5-phosphate isomerase